MNNRSDDKGIYRSLMIQHNSQGIELKILTTPDCLPAEQANWIVYVCKRGRWNRGTFITYPSDSNKNDWNQPVEWIDDQFLYVPTLDEDSISTAVLFLLEVDKLEEAFECCEEPSETFTHYPHVASDYLNSEIRSNAEERVFVNITNSLSLLKLLGCGGSKKEMKKEILAVIDEVLDRNSF